MSISKFVVVSLIIFSRVESFKLFLYFDFTYFKSEQYFLAVVHSRINNELLIMFNTDIYLKFVAKRIRPRGLIYIITFYELNCRL